MNNLKRVFVYFNLHKKVWSVKDLKTGKVIFHTRCLTLRDCQFKVSQAGRRRVLAERRKNVHAGVVGTLIAIDQNPHKFSDQRLVTYNPYKYETFVQKLDEKPVSQADTVFMDASTMPRVYAW